MTSGKVRRDDHTVALLRATLLVMVLAVFAMHALVSHQHVHSGHAAAFPLIDAGDKTQHSHADVTPGDTTEIPDSPDDEAPYNHGGAGECCLALLCIFAALLAFTLGHGGSNRVLYALRRWATPTHPWISRSGDPPCIHQLSILRC
ncbi:hypothetical protein [Streptomyces rochei]|uniref:hypothetical protein n=1 Tax=Streptomyces rochei TaxID=1928 RepID=UPI0033B9E5FF